MTIYTITNTVSGATIGTYEGATEAEALDAMARDAGYDSHADMLKTIESDGSDIRVEETPSTKAYEAGLADGLAWDLDGYKTRAQVESADDWDAATIGALTHEEWCAHVGLSDDCERDSEEYTAACAEYNRGVRAGALAPQDERTGLGID
jgi:hypothetical protein